jgi:ElaB/YqjD/DUF883 family membrane-anchored ribosome-binding protein
MQNQGRGQSGMNQSGMSKGKTMQQGENTSRTDMRSSTQSKGLEASSQEDSSAVKSIGAVIGESLAKDTQERVDQVMERVNEYFRAAKEYVTENPKETAAVVASAGLAAWVLLYTKPGRQLFEKGSAILVPQISTWITNNFSANATTKH